ncbi:MAG TPA: tetraacyldisaccharide 4'-kinase [Candidatus Saccharimonadales bacterium]|nr:tetraacyldisaccharide 4'-kinase [Candidatus Saccharimonadales bacterium]
MNLPPMLRLLLWPLSVLYGQFVRLRTALYARGTLRQQRLNRPVISVGNLTVGGTGKTPMVIWLAERFLAEGKRVGILSRGYKGAGGTSDEIELMKYRLKNRVLFGVGPDRFANGTRLEPNVDLFLLDDGFQHLQLARDVDILLMDASQPLARQMMLPTGRLREPVSAMGRADVLVFTRAETVPGTSAAVERFQGYPVFSAATRLLGFRRWGADMETLTREEIGPGPFYAFCGIGNPKAFFRDLQNWSIPLASQCEFPDHHRYDQRDVAELVSSARRAGANALLTTEKDAQNLTGVNFSEMPVYLAVIDFEIAKETALLDLLNEKMAARMSIT